MGGVDGKSADPARRLCLRPSSRFLHDEPNTADTRSPYSTLFSFISLGLLDTITITRPYSTDAGHVEAERIRHAAS